MEKKEFDKRLYSPTHKMGFKILSDDQLANIFPTVENMERKFETHRKNISKIDDVKAHGTEFDFQYNLMYDSIFSIWGKRGSGKTSAIFTLKYRLEKKNKNDLFLPIIMPEMLPVNCDIIGWILAVLDSEVSKLENIIKNNISLTDDDEFFKHCVFDPNNNKLRVSYKKTKELASSRNMRSFGWERSYAENIGYTERYTQNSYDFSRQLADFWDILVQSIKKAYGMRTNEEPLIYIMFDDVDLTPDKVVELFSVIIKYLSHPNLIVITTADEELFRDVIESDLRKRIGQDTLDDSIKKVAVAMLGQWDDYKQIIEYVQKDTAIQKQVKETAELYIDKVLPPSERYYLELFDTCEKRRYFIENTDEEGENKNIEQFFSEQITKLHKRVYGKNIKEDNFLYYKKGIKKIFGLPYLLFMGNTSRQLTNQCFILEEMIDGIIAIYDKSDIIPIKNKQQYLHREVYRQVEHFWYNSINAGNILKIDDVSNSELIERILLYQKEEYSIYINYQYILEYYKINSRSVRENERKLLVLKNSVALFMLAFFTENVLLIGDNSGNKRYAINPERKKIHGIEDLIELFDMVTFSNDVSLLKKSDDKDDKFKLQTIMYLFEKVIIYPETAMAFSVSNFSSVREYLYDLLSKEIPYKIGAILLESWSHKNPVWFRTVSKILYLYFEGIYTAEKPALNKLDLNVERIGGDTFSQRWVENINLNDGVHLLDIILMLGSKNDYIYRRFQAIARAIVEQSIEEPLRLSFEQVSYGTRAIDKKCPYLTASDIEENFLETIKDIYPVSKIKSQYGNELGEKDIIAAIGIKRFLLKDSNFKEQNEELNRLVKDIMRENILKNNEIKKWLTLTIYSLEEKIYDVLKSGANYIVLDIDEFKDNILNLYDLEKSHGLGNIQIYRKILDFCEKNKDNTDQLHFENQLILRLYQQINRTKRNLLRIADENIFMAISSNVDEYIDIIEKNLFLAAYDYKDCLWMENYVFMLYTLRYFMDLFYAITFQEQKNKNMQRSNNEKSFGNQMYQIMIPAVKSAVPENVSGGKEKSAQYYLGNILRTYFIEAGNEYIEKWRHNLDE